MINKHLSYTVSKHQRTLGFSGILAVIVFLISVCFVMGFTYPQSSILTLTTTPSPKNTSTPLPTSTILPTATPQPSNSGNNLPAEKDWWDKAGVISQFFSGVVIAVVGLLITYTIQRTQIKVAQDTAEAQIKSAEIQAKEERRLQQGQLTAQLVEHLTSESDEVREIAIVALRESVPEKIYDSVVEILARSDRSTLVRQKAIQQLGLSQNDKVAKALNQIALDPERSDTERKLAAESTNRVIISSNLSEGTLVFTATNQFSHAYEFPELEAGVFTHFLIQGLNGKADIDGDGTISAFELCQYVTEQVKTYKPETKQQPAFVIESQGELPIVGTKATYSAVVGLIIGVSNYSNSIPNLRYPRPDAEKLYSFFAKSNLESSKLHLLIDESATRKNIVNILDSISSEAPKDSLFVFYYSGHGAITSGELVFLASDSIINQMNTLLPFSYVKSCLKRTRAIAKVVFLDSDIPGGISAPK